MGRDTIQLEIAVSTISQEYLLEFTSEYGISEDLHPELPAPGDRIVDFPEDKIGVYTKNFEFANFCILISQFLFDVLGYYQIYLSQLSVIGASKVSHFEIHCRVLNVIPSVILFHVFYIPSFNSGWMSFSKRPGKNTPQCYTKPLDSLKNWNSRFFWVDERVFPTVVDWRESAPKDEKPAEGSYSVEDVASLDTRRTPIQKQPEALLCLVGLSRRYYLGDDVYPTFLYDDGREMDLFNLISAPNPAKIKTSTRPHAAHEVSLLIVTANHVIDMEESGDGTEDQVLETGASEVPPTGHASTTGVASNIVIEGEDAADVPLVSKRRRKWVNDGANANALSKVLRKDFDVSRPAQSTFRGKSFASTGLEAGSTLSAPASQGTPAGTIDPDPLSFAEPQPAPARDIAESSKGATIAGDPDSKKSSSFTSFAGLAGSIYQPGWGITNSCRFDTPGACQDAVDHMVLPGYFSEMRHLPNEEFLNQYNVNLVRQVAMGSQLQLRFEQEVRLLKKAKEKGLRNQTRNLKTLLEAEVDMKKVAEANSAELTRELESLRAKFVDLQVNNNQLFQQVSTLQAQVTSEEQIKAIFEEFKKREDDKVERRCAEIDARLDALSIDFDGELYPYMLTAIAGRRWVIEHGLCLAVMKCAESTDLRQGFANVVSAGIAKGVSEGLKHGVEHRKAQLDLEVIEAYDPEADAKYVVALHALKDLKYPLIDHLEKLKDAPIDLIMASLHLESDVRDHRDPWAFKEEMLLEDAIMASVSRAEKKKKCRVVCRTHGIGSAHHPRSDGILVSVPTVAPQGLAILLTDVATRTETTGDEVSPRLIRSKSLPPMYNLD
ncbi:hypothetical protein Tco_0260448 [Tanacetum coccineum]